MDSDFPTGSVSVQVERPDALEVAAFHRSQGYAGPVSGDAVFVSARAGPTLIGLLRVERETGLLVLRGMTVEGSRRRQGIGTIMLTTLAPLLDEVCWCIPYRSLINFYRQIGFVEMPAEGAPPHLIARANAYRKNGLDVALMRRHSQAAGKKPLEPAPIDAALLLQILSPRPLVWVTTRNPEGTANIAPFSAVMLVDDDPPVLLLIVKRLADGSSKATARNIAATKSFVVNTPASSMLPKLMRSAAPDVLPPERCAVAEIRLIPCAAVDGERISGAHAALECELNRQIPINNEADMFLGSIVAVHSDLLPIERPGPFVGALGYEWFVTEQGAIFVDQPYLSVDT